tara:strand:- start:1950 stop:2777 length:828 start_codon:yes stop_codon:yes gene_type:complete
MDKKITNLGPLKGKILLFGGVYSNLQALEMLRSIAEKHQIPAENCISTGDLVGYCAQPEESVQYFKDWGAISIAGNVELQLREGEEDCGCSFRPGSRCDQFSKQWYPYAQSKLSKNSLEFMQALPDHFEFTYAGKKISVVHGSFQNISEFIFKSTPWATKAANFEATCSDVIIAGHCGLPFNEEQDGKIWINPGVIGMPANDGTPQVWYVILDDKNGKFNYSHHRMHYNHKLTSSLMDNGLLPIEYARTINTGIWDNCEILPIREMGYQGFGINL